MVWTRERLATTTDGTEEAADAAQKQWDEFRDWLVLAPPDEAVFYGMSDSRMRLPRTDFSTTEAAAARAYMEARAAERG